jgi:hypothetical protein
MSRSGPMKGTVGAALFPVIPLLWPECQAIEFAVYLSMVGSAVFLVKAKGEFPGESASEHLFGPPKGWSGTGLNSSRNNSTVVRCSGHAVRGIRRLTHNSLVARIPSVPCAESATGVLSA